MTQPYEYMHLRIASLLIQCNYWVSSRVMCLISRVSTRHKCVCRNAEPERMRALERIVRAEGDCCHLYRTDDLGGNRKLLLRRVFNFVVHDNFTYVSVTYMEVRSVPLAFASLALARDHTRLIHDATCLGALFHLLIS